MENNVKESREEAIAESQLLLEVLLSLHVEWRQKDLAVALEVSPGFISMIQKGEKKLSAGRRELARYKICDEIAQFTGSFATYGEIKEIARCYIALHRDETEDAEAPSRMLEMARRLYEDGYIII